MRLRVVDIETTGLAPPQAEVIELGMQDVVAQTDGSEARLQGEGRNWMYAPERPCPPEVMAVHHILPRDLEGRAFFDQAVAMLNMREHTGHIVDVWVAHNAEFEQSFLPEFERLAPWICTYKAALRVWPEAPGHGNQVLMYWLGLHEELDEDLRHPPHRAAPDAYVTAAILTRLLRHATPDQMIEWTLQPRLLPTCPIGKFRGRPWPEVEEGFLGWMLRTPDMEADLKWNARRELERRRTAHLAGSD